MRLILILTTLLAFQSAAASEFDEMKALADQGDADAQFYLGNVYLNGEGLQENVVEAVKWYRKAADQGYVKAQFNLAQAYFIGKGVPKNVAEAVKWYRKAAEQGDANAQYNLALCYNNGEGVPKNIAESVKWYRKAADQGVVQAQYSLGLMYTSGHGVPKNVAEAVKWYRKAAEQGYVEAQYNLGVIYGGGEGVPKNVAESVKWYKKAADQGYADAQYNLGVIYGNGGGLSEDDTSAVKAFTFSETHISIEPPKELREMSQDFIDYKWRNGSVQWAFGNDTGATTIGIGLTQYDISEIALSELLSQYKDSFSRMIPGIKWINSKVIELSGAEWLYLELQSNAIDASIHNIMLLTSYGKQQLILNFNSTTEEFDKYQSGLRASIQSIEIDWEALKFDTTLVAAKQGDTQAQYELGVLYGAGKGTKKDYSNAYLWWLISARLGGEADLEFAASLLEEKEIMKTKLLAVKCYESNYQECD